MLHDFFVFLVSPSGSTWRFIPLPDFFPASNTIINVQPLGSHTELEAVNTLTHLSCVEFAAEEVNTVKEAGGSSILSNPSFVSPQDSKMFSVNVNSSKRMNLILTSSHKSYGAIKCKDGVNIYVSDAFLCFHVNSHTAFTTYSQNSSHESLCCV